MKLIYKFLKINIFFLKGNNKITTIRNNCFTLYTFFPYLIPTHRINMTLYTIQKRFIAEQNVI